MTRFCLNYTDNSAEIAHQQPIYLLLICVPKMCPSGMRASFAYTSLANCGTHTHDTEHVPRNLGKAMTINKRIIQKGRTQNSLEGSVAPVPRQKAGVVRYDRHRRLSPASVGSRDHETKPDL